MSDSYVRERERVDRGAALPDSASGLACGEYAARSPKIGPYYECEHAVITDDGRILSEWKWHAEQAGVPGCWDFYRGWMAAMNGGFRWGCAGDCERLGWDAYPRTKAVDPWVGLGEGWDREKLADDRDDERERMLRGVR